MKRERGANIYFGGEYHGIHNTAAAGLYKVVLAT